MTRQEQIKYLHKERRDYALLHADDYIGRPIEWVYYSVIEAYTRRIIRLVEA